MSWIDRRDSLIWPPKSANVIPLDFCYGAGSKNEVYKAKVNSQRSRLSYLEHTPKIWYIPSD